MIFNNINPFNITGTFTSRNDDDELQKFKKYYNCSVYPTEKVARYQKLMPMSSNFPEQFQTYREEKVYSIELTESMLKDLMDNTNKMMSEAEMRERDPRLMKMYSEYMTLLNLLK